jgi:hypothetical protein
MSLVLNVEILGEFKKLTAATAGAESQLQTMGKKAANISKSINRAFAGIGLGLSFTLLAREIGEATKAAVEDRKSQDLLANQLENTTNATDAQIKAVEKQIGVLQLTSSIADDKLRPAYAQLLRATGDTTQAMKLLNLATDVSAGSGKDLTSITTALSKAYQGKMSALTKLGIPMSDSIQNASDYAAAMTKLNKLQSEAVGLTGSDYTKAMEKVAEQQDKVNRIAEAGIDWQGDLAAAFKGSAAEAANTDPYQKMQIIFGEIQERIGSALLPVLDDFAAWMSSPPGQAQLKEIADAAKDVLTQLADTAKWAIANKDWLLPLAVGAGAFNTTISAISGITAAVNGVTLAVNALKAAAGTSLLAGLGAAAGVVGVGALGAGVGGYQQGLALAEQSKAYAGILDPNTFSGKTVAPVVSLGSSPRVAERAPVNVVINTPKVSAQDVVNIINKAQKTGYTGQITMPRS